MRPHPSIKALFAETNRGMLFDILIFFANLFLFHYLTDAIVEIFQEASGGNEVAKLALGLAAVGMWVFPATGAVLKRWHLHERLKSQGKTIQMSFPSLFGCLFNPIFYFSLNLVITSAILTVFGELVLGDSRQSGAVFVPLIILGFILTVGQTTLIYLYFSPPKKPPKSDYLKDPRSELAGDLLLFLNLLMFQVAWNFVAEIPMGRPGSLLDFAGRLFLLCFLALLIYFPPRMFYLAEDIRRPATWLTMLLANSPVIARMLFGTAPTLPLAG